MASCSDSNGASSDDGDDDGDEGAADGNADVPAAAQDREYALLRSPSCVAPEKRESSALSTNDQREKKEKRIKKYILCKRVEVDGSPSGRAGFGIFAPLFKNSL